MPPKYTFRPCIFYFGQNDPIKVPISTLSNVLVKICQNFHVILQTTSQFFFKFCTTLPSRSSVLYKITPLYLFDQTLYTLHKRKQ